MAWLFPAAEQQWAHSCCSASSLESAFQGPVTAIEADILMGTIESEHGEVPIMAHPPCRTSDLSFEDFWQRCLAEARHHLKLDFKDPGTQGPRDPGMGRICTSGVWNGTRESPFEIVSDALNSAVAATSVEVVSLLCLSNSTDVIMSGYQDACVLHAGS